MCVGLLWVLVCATACAWQSEDSLFSPSSTHISGIKLGSSHLEAGTHLWGAISLIPEVLLLRQGFLYRKASLEFVAVLSTQSPKCWEYRCEPTQWAIFFNFHFEVNCINFRTLDFVMNLLTRNSNIPCDSYHKLLVGSPSLRYSDIYLSVIFCSNPTP